MLYYASRISDNILKREPEGYLICLNVPIARSGTQKYRKEELDEPGEGIVTVYRPADEVFSKRTMGSFEGMPVTNDHPDDEEGVTVDNISYLQKGHAQNIRRGTGDEEDLLIADLLITDQTTIQDVLDGKREVSCGYNYELREENGRFVQREIRGNHIAIVDRGRAGKRVSIKDSATTNERRKPKMRKKNHSHILAKGLAALVASDAQPDEIEEMVDAIEELTAPEAPVEPETKVTDEDIHAKLDQITDMLQNPSGAPAAAEPVAEEPVQKDEEPDKLDVVIGLLNQLLQQKSADEAPAEETDPLEKLENDLDELEKEAPEEAEEDEDVVVEEEEEEITPDEDPTEPESHFVGPEEINEEDEDEEEEEDKPQMDRKACDAMRAAIRAVKPIIAKLPPSERRAAKDAAVASLRQSYGMSAKPARNDYLRIKQRRRTADNAAKAANDDQELGKRIMMSRNANYKNKN